MARAPFVIVSNRGPLSFRHDDDGALVARRGAGGLVSGLGPLVQGTDTTWIASAISDGDREAASEGVVEAEGFRVRLLASDPARYRAAYDVICNGTLWFVLHSLYDRARLPRFDRIWWQAWDAYREINDDVVRAVAETAPEGATVLVQDYHLFLVGAPLAERRPDLRTVHFSHTPFAGPDDLRVLPPAAAEELLRGMVGHGICGFHSARWADAYRASCREVLGEEPPTFVSPLASDPDDIAAVAASAACDAELRALEERVGDRAVIGRVDRIELSKNLLRGFHAYELLLSEQPDWHDRVVFVASVYPSREGLASYLAYRQEVEGLARRINERFGTASWTPIELDTSDDFPRSVAVLRRADVLLVNPIRDGLNLVAKEMALVNDRDGVLVLSPEAGIYDDLGDVCLPVHPYDVAGTADVLDRALRLEGTERQRLAERLRERARQRTAAHWLDEQLAAAPS